MRFYERCPSLSDNECPLYLSWKGDLTKSCLPVSVSLDR